MIDLTKNTCTMFLLLESINIFWSCTLYVYEYKTPGSKLPNKTHVLSLSIKEQLWFAAVLCLSTNEFSLNKFVSAYKSYKKHASKLSNTA